MKFRFGDERTGHTLTFNNILPDIIEDLNLKDSYIIQEMCNNWINYVGGILAVHSQPDRIFKKTLFINADHSVYLNELSLQTKNIMKKINDDYGNNFIMNIKLNIKSLNWKLK